MRAAVFLGLAFSSLVSTAPLEKEVEARADDFIPYLVEDACRQDDPKLEGINRYAKLLSAVKDARDMAQQAVREWWDEGKHGEIAAQYLAIPDDGKYKDNEFAQRVHENLRLVGLLDERQPFLSKKVNVHCTDISNKCNLRVEGTNQPIAGYAENGGNIITGYTYDVAFCEPWFRLQSRILAWNTWKDQPKEDIAMEWLENDAGKMLHEMLHTNIITQGRPHIEDRLYNGARAYGAPKISEWIANGARTADVVQNADSYTQFVNAIYFKGKFGYLPPPRRLVPIIEALECSGDPDQYVDKTQDKHIAHFCDLVANEYTPGSIGEVIYTYQDDTVESLNLRFYRRPNGKLTADVVKEQCLESIPKIFHGCDTSSRWKHGGYYRFTQGDEELYEYQVRPLHERPNPIPENPVAACEVWYKHEITEYVVDFTMSGGLFASDDYGREKLRPSLEKWCTSVKNWEFLYHQEPTRDTHFEWNAKGRFSSDAGLEAPMCVQQAIVDAGGPTVTCAFHWNAR